jgi:hypothetical protein
VSFACLLGSTFLSISSGHFSALFVEVKNYHLKYTDFQGAQGSKDTEIEKLTFPHPPNPVHFKWTESFDFAESYVFTKQSPIISL